MSRPIKAKERETIIQSLKSGVVPRAGLQHIQVGRSEELKSFIKDIDTISEGGTSFRFVIGEYGSGKTFFLSLVRSIALEKWRRVKGKDGWMAAKAFIKHFNRKLYTSESSSEVNWAWWYFPLITTDKSLKEIDAYMQDCVRYIATGKRTKARYNFTYDQMKELGLLTLVNKWHRFKKHDN